MRAGLDQQAVRGFHVGYGFLLVPDWSTRPVTNGPPLLSEATQSASYG
ncbi:MAG: hypothetical protein KTR25_09200 [Myxococcales bacterium]|nr:hypothetical protein [Myxococcales bacterium]